MRKIGKKKATKEYYSLKKILREEAQYNLLIGMRSNGKSYAVKEHVLRKAYENDDYMFAYIRRYDTQTKAGMVKKYFGDMPIKDITEGEYSGITVYSDTIYYTYYDEDSNRFLKGKEIGSVLALNTSQNIKSLTFPKVSDIIFEEFLTTARYLENEPTELQQLLSTILRERNGQVWLIGNKINRVCPYFAEWGLKNVLTQEEDTIEIYKHSRMTEDGKDYTVKIAVENCRQKEIESNMFWDKTAKSITSSEWETKDYPKFPSDKSKTYTMLYEVMLRDCGFPFVLQLYVENETGGQFVYVYPYTRTRNIKRIITTVFSSDPLTTANFNDTINAEVVMRKCIRSNKICFSDNLTGTDFYQVLQNRKGVL